jgi:16S rRNA (uracil1498-N3)-methyltransferase
MPSRKASPARCLVDDLSVAARGDVLSLGERARHHLDHVRRLRAGDAVELRDGRGGAAEARWRTDGRVELVAAPELSPPPAHPLWLAVAPPRLPRLDWLVEKATELGVARLLLLDVAQAQREVRQARQARLQRKADAALLQCGRRHALELDGPWTLERVLDLAAPAPGGGPPGAALWLADPQAGAAPPVPRPAGPLLALVGPEGGFTGAERQAALDAGARPVALGPHVLRVETAALALAAWAAGAAPAG